MFDAIGDNYLVYELQLAQVQLSLFMLGMGATLTVKDFALVAYRPKALLVGLTCVLILGPLLGVLTANIIDPTPGVAFGLVLLGAMPGGSLSNVFTFLARGNVALSISMSAIAAFIALFSIPLTLKALVGGIELDGFEMDAGAIVLQILLYALLPLAVGMVILRASSRYAPTVSKVATRIGFFLVVLMIVGALSSGRIEVDAHGFWVPLAIIIFIVAMQQLSMLGPRLIGWHSRDVVAIGAEVTMRNTFLAISLAALMFPPGGELSELGNDVMFVILFYGGASLVIGTPLALRFRRVMRRLEREGRVG